MTTAARPQPSASRLAVAFDARSLASPSLRGWDRYTLGLAQGLSALGVEVSFLYRERQPLHLPHLEGLTCKLLPLADRGGLHWTQKALPQALSRGRFDLYHAPAEQGVPLLAPCPVVLTVHSVISFDYAALVEAGELPGPLSAYLGYEVKPWSFASLYWRAQILRAHHVLAPSAYCQRQIVKHLHLPEERVTATLLGLPEVFRQPPLPPEERRQVLQSLGVRSPFILHVGGYEQHKNPHGLLQAFAYLAARRPELSLVMVGSRGVPDALRQLAGELGIEARVTFLYDLTDALPSLYDEASLLVSLSWLETFCLPALEGMSRGLLPVCSRWGGVPEVVGGIGWLVDPRDPQAAAEVIDAALDASDRPQRAAAAVAHARLFSWQRLAEATYRVYQGLTARSR